MFTYIINTSENKTFDIDNLFSIVKYNKIKWIYSRLDKLDETARYIYEKQNTLDAEEFRIVVLIDFYGFDRIKKPYAKDEYNMENGVDVNLYIPFIQMYVFDHLFNYLENHDIWSTDCEIYYIQNEKYEGFSHVANSEQQIKRILSPVDYSKGVLLSADEYDYDYLRKSEASKKLINIEDLRIKYDKKIVLANFEYNILLKSNFLTKSETDETVEEPVDGSNVDDSKKEAKLIKKLEKLYNDHVILKAAEYKKLENAKILTRLLEFNEEGELVDDNQFKDAEVVDLAELRKRNENNDLLSPKEYRYLQDDDFLRQCYGTYRLYCTHNISLDFNLLTYPYNSFVKAHTIPDERIDELYKEKLDNDRKLEGYMAQVDTSLSEKEREKEELLKETETKEKIRFDEERKLTLKEFYSAFKDRAELHNYRIRSHYHVIGYSTSPTKAAFDSLTLSLYLIRAYEREEEIVELDFDTDVYEYEQAHSEKKISLDRKVLIDTLVLSWNRVNMAKDIAKKANINYYDLITFAKNSVLGMEEKEKSPEEILKDCQSEVDNELRNTHQPSLTADQLFDAINGFGVKGSEKIPSSEREHFNKLFTKYLDDRLENDESGDQENFMNNRANFDKVPQCPSEVEYNRADQIQREKVSSLFNKALSSKYLESTYDEEKEHAYIAYNEYKFNEKKLRGKRGQFIIMGIVLVVMLVPYIFINREIAKAFNVSNVVLYLETAGLFLGLYLGLFALKCMPLKRRMRNALGILKGNYNKCLVKQKMSWHDYEMMYKEYLSNIEKIRYKNRDLYRLHCYNIKLNDNVELHRQKLEMMEESLSTMLNNLGVQPKVDHNEEEMNSAKESFKLDKQVDSADNEIYKVFSIDTIDRLFENSRGAK